jgi:hypothetical protein
MMTMLALFVSCLLLSLFMRFVVCLFVYDVFVFVYLCVWLVGLFVCLFVCCFRRQFVS